MFKKVAPIPGFNFPYSVEYLVTGSILVGIGALIVVGIVVAVLEATVPHIKQIKRAKHICYNICSNICCLEKRGLKNK